MRRGVRRREQRVVEIQPREHRRSKARDEHIGGEHELEERLTATRLLEVQCDAALAPIGAEEDGTGAVIVLAESAKGIAGRRFDLDDVRTEVAQHHGAEGDGHEARELDHSDSV